MNKTVGDPLSAARKRGPRTLEERDRRERTAPAKCRHFSFRDPRMVKLFEPSGRKPPGGIDR